MFTYEDLLAFVERNDYQNKSFSKVIELYKKEMQEYYDGMQADSYLASLEAHELIMY